MPPVSSSAFRIRIRYLAAFVVITDAASAGRSRSAVDPFSTSVDLRARLERDWVPLPDDSWRRSYGRGGWVRSRCR